MKYTTLILLALTGLTLAAVAIPNMKGMPRMPRLGGGQSGSINMIGY